MNESEARAEFDDRMAAEYERGLTLGLSKDRLRELHRAAWEESQGDDLLSRVSRYSLSVAAKDLSIE